jgi:hypothetical protein
MKRAHLEKFLIPLALVILFFSFASTAWATNNASKVTRRPLTYWSLNNPAVIYAYGGYPPRSDQLYAIFFSICNIPTVPCPYPPDTFWYDGYITERELFDGRAELTIYIDFQDWEIARCIGYKPSWESYMIFEEGFTMSGRVVTKIILPEPDMEIPWLFDIFFGFVEGEFVSESMTATGYGTFTEDAANFGFTPGATGKVTLVARNLITPAPFSDPVFGWWPVELINILEMPT